MGLGFFGLRLLGFGLHTFFNTSCFVFCGGFGFGLEDVELRVRETRW